MKKKIVLILAILMCISLCACGGSESTSNSENKVVEQNDDKGNGFTPNQPSDTSNKVETEVENVVSEMTVEEMMQYYDAEQYVGTPSVKKMMFLYISGNDDYYCFVDEADIFSGNLRVEYDERLTVGDTYKCIVCDNDTPDFTRDDIVVYVFMD
jgi:hypothetical protein